MLNLDKEVLSVNPAARKMLGISSLPDIVGKRLSELDSPLAAELEPIPLYDSQTVRLNDANIYKCTHSSFVDRGFHHSFYLVEMLTQEVFKAEKKAYEKVTREFLDIYTRLLRGEKVDYHGEHIHVEGAEVLFPPVQENGPPLYFGGSSDAAIDVAAEQIDSYLTWGEPPELVAEKLAVVRERAAARGRTLQYGIRLHVIVRETEEEAWAAADRLIAHLDDDTIAQAQKIFARMDSAGQARMSALHQGSRDNLRIAPNLWAGVGLVRGGAGTALVGNPQQVAERIREYQALGISNFIFSGYPHLEEAHRFAELVMPLLPLENGASSKARSVNTGPFGETIGGDKRPVRQVSAS